MNTRPQGDKQTESAPSKHPQPVRVASSSEANTAGRALETGDRDNSGPIFSIEDSTSLPVVKSRYESHIADLGRRINRRNRQIDQMYDELDAQDHHIKVQVEKIDELDEQVDEMEYQLADKDRQLRKKDDRRAEMEAAAAKWENFDDALSQLPEAERVKFENYQRRMFRKIEVTFP